MGMIAMLALLAIGLVRHAPPSFYAVLATVGASQAAIVYALDRRVRKRTERLLPEALRPTHPWTLGRRQAAA